MKTRPQLLMALFLSVVCSVNAQNPVLQEYIQEGLQRNLQLKNEQLHYERSIEGLNQAKALFMPQISSQASYTLAGGGRRLQFPVGDLLNPVYATLNQLTNSNNFPQIGNVDEQFLPNNFHDTKLRVIQPLFNPDIYFNYKANKELSSIQEAQRLAYENELKFAITSAYYQYLRAEEAQLIWLESQKLLIEVRKLNQALFESAKITKDVLLNADYELSKIDQQVLEARNTTEMAQAYFNFLLNKPLNSEIRKDPTVFMPNELPGDLDQLNYMATENRAEMHQIQGSIRAGEIMVSLNKNKAIMPTLLAVGDIGYQGFGYEFNKDQQYYLVQFSLSWDLFRGGEKRSKIQQVKLEQQVSENKLEQVRQQIELQLLQAYNDYTTASTAYKTATQGEQSAESAFLITKMRYEEGQALAIELMDAQNKLTNARLNKSLNRYQWLSSEAALLKTISTL